MARTREIALPWRRQPSAPRIDWDNPITRGLNTLMWLGPGGPRDMIGPQDAFAGAITMQAGPNGMATAPVTSLKSANYLGHARWKIARPPFSVACFSEITSVAEHFFSSYTANGSTGYALRKLYSTGRYRGTYVALGANVYANTVGEWDAGFQIRGMTVGAVGLTTYDSGVAVQSQAVTIADVTYNGTFDALHVSGSGGRQYWMATWLREVNAGEFARLRDNPWQLFAPQTRRVWVPVGAGGGVTLAVANATHAHIAGALTLSTDSLLSIAAATHAHAADNLTLGTTGATSLAVADAVHGHTADGVGLSTDAHLSIAAAAHAHAADSITLGVSGATTLAIAGAAHAHAADAVTLITASLLTIAGATHAHTASGVTISAETLLAIADAVHAHTADNVDISGAPYLQIASGLHAQTADGVTMTVDAWLTVASATHGHAAGNVVLVMPGGTTQREVWRGASPICTLFVGSSPITTQWSGTSAIDLEGIA